tara:strand:- start:105 stop:485 length:381 start_codon:yes stop_codon:yes gene_type:complete
MKLNYEEFHNIRKMLSSDDEEDIALALETLSNMDNNPVLMTILAKSLYHHGRDMLMKKFHIARFCCTEDKFEWTELYLILKRNMDESMVLEKRLIEEAIHLLVKDIFRYEDLDEIIKEFKIKLNYE